MCISLDIIMKAEVVKLIKRTVIFVGIDKFSNAVVNPLTGKVELTSYLYLSMIDLWKRSM